MTQLYLIDDVTGVGMGIHPVGEIPAPGAKIGHIVGGRMIPLEVVSISTETKNEGSIFAELAYFAHVKRL